MCVNSEQATGKVCKYILLAECVNPKHPIRNPSFNPRVLQCSVATTVPQEQRPIASGSYLWIYYSCTIGLERGTELSVCRIIWMVDQNLEGRSAQVHRQRNDVRQFCHQPFCVKRARAHNPHVRGSSVSRTLHELCVYSRS
jgi:hypothetical protein